MTTQHLVLIISLTLSVVVATSSTLKIALLYTKESPQSETAFNHAIKKINDDDRMLPETLIEGVAVNIGSNSDNPASSTYKMCRLLTENNITSIVGPFTSAQVKECSYIAGQMGLPIVSPTATDPYLKHKFWAPTLATLSPSNKEQAVAIVDLLQYYHWKKVSIMYTNDPYGVTLREAVKEQLHKREMEVLTEVEIEHAMVRELIPPEMTKPWIEQLLNSATRITLLLVQPDYADIILEAAAEHGMIDSVYGWIASTAVTASFLNAYTDKGRIKPHYDGVVGLSPYMNETGKDYKDLKDAYNRAGLKLTPVDALVYDAVYLIGNSVNKIYRDGSDQKPEIINFGGQCYEEFPSTDWQLGTEIYRKFTTTRYKGINGLSQVWPHKQPSNDSYKYNIVNFSRKYDNVATVGYWNSTNTPSVTIRNPPFWTHSRLEAPTDNPLLPSLTLKLGVLEDKPFIIYNYTTEGFPNCSSMPDPDWCYTGVSIEIIKHLQKKLKFNCEFIESPDGKFGNKVDEKTWNGLINEVFHKKIDIGIVGFGTSESRETVVDFGVSLYPAGVRMATSTDKAAATTNYFFFLKPFSLEIWMSMLCCIVLFFVLVVFLDNYSPYGHAGGVKFKCRLCGCAECKGLLKRGGIIDYVCPFKEDHELKHEMGIMSVPNALWLSLCSFLAVAPADGIPKNWSGRIVISVWWLICMVMVSMYTANLAAFLTVSKGVDISNVNELLAQDDYYYGTVVGSITENLLLSSKNEQLNKIYKGSTSTKSYDEAVARMKLGSYVFLYGSGPLELTTSKDCSLKLIGDVLIHFGYAFAFQTDSPYLEPFNREMLIMKEKGTLLDLWHKFVKGHCDENDMFDAEADSLKVKSLLGLLLIAIPMLIVAAIVFGLEIFASPKKKGKRNMGTGEVIRAQFEETAGKQSVEAEHSDLEETAYEVPRQYPSSLEYVSPEIPDLADPTDSVYQLEKQFLSHNPGTCTVSDSIDIQAHVAILTDASVTGWGATNLYTRKNVRGYWREEERAMPAHLLELKAVYLSLKIYCKYQDNVHMQVNLDNQFAVDCINGKQKQKESQPVTFIKRKIWELALQCNVTLTSHFLDGNKSITANLQSRLPVDSTDWTFTEPVYDNICRHFNITPEIDLFATMITSKCPVFVSKLDDPKSFAVNAFKQRWDAWDYVYCFPPINDKVLIKVVKKISQCRCKVLLIIPWWTKSKWFAQLQNYIIQEPYQLGRDTILKHPHDQRLTHSLYPKLRLAAVVCQVGAKKDGGYLPDERSETSKDSETGGLPPSAVAHQDENVAINDISGVEFLKKV